MMQARHPPDCYAGHYRAGAHHPRIRGAESRHASAPRSARGDRAADARSVRRVGRHDDRRSDGRDEFLQHCATLIHLRAPCWSTRVGPKPGDLEHHRRVERIPQDTPDVLTEVHLDLEADLDLLIDDPKIDTQRVAVEC